MLLGAGTFGAGQSPAGSTAWAVVVGVDQYRSPDIPGLRGAVRDATGIAAALERYAGIPRDHISVFLSDGPEEQKPTAGRILNRFLEVGDQASADDLVIFFFAGHGIERSGQQFLLTYETNRATTGDLMTTSLPSATLMLAFQRIKARHHLIMIDACRDDPTSPTRNASVSFEREFHLPRDDERALRATLLSTTTGQSAYEWRTMDRGYFSYFIEQGLSGEALSSGGGGVTVYSLADYVASKVYEKVKADLNKDQTPIPDVSGKRWVLVPLERLTPPTNQAPPVGPPPVPTRTVHGVVQNSDGTPLKNVSINISSTAPVRRSLTVATRPESQAGLAAAGAVVTTDESGFYTLDGVPADQEIEIRATLSGYSDFITTTPPDKSGEDTPIVLTRLVSAADQAMELARVAVQAFLVESFEQAGASARAALALDPNHPLATTVLANVTATELVNAAAVQATIDESKQADAKRLADRSFQIGPRLALAHNARGLVSFAAGDYGNARRAFEAALKIDKDLAVAHANLGETHLRQKRYADAERSFKQAIRLSPDTAIPYNGLATALYSRGRYDDAIRASRQAIARHARRDPTLAAFYANLAVVLSRRGNHDQAVEAVEQAKGLGRTTDSRYEDIAVAAQKARRRAPRPGQ